MADPSFLFITIDATDAPAAATFWAALLGTTVDAEMDDGRFIFLEGRDGLPVICIQRVPEPRQGKTRIHIDLGVDDLETATARVLELGGSWDGEDRRLERFTWRTCADPEGTEFDISLVEG
ncbi:MAG TPA: VOC family protein [Actinomycetota bacterium]|nr:VOC family protein [Actinomycetota bacterium]